MLNSPLTIGTRICSAPQSPTSDSASFVATLWARPIEHSPKREPTIAVKRANEIMGTSIINLWLRVSAVPQYDDEHWMRLADRRRQCRNYFGGCFDRSIQ